MRNRLANIMLLLCISLIAGSTFAAIKIAVQSFSVYEITFLRSSLGFIVAAPFMARLRHWRALNFTSWLYVAGMAFIGIMLPFTLLNWAGKQIDSSTVGILWSTLPLFGVLLAHFLTKNDVLGFGKVAAVILGAVSVWMISRGALGSAGAAGIMPHLAVVVSALCYAISGVLQRRVSSKISAMFLTGLTMAMCAIASFAIWPVTLTFDGRTAGSLAAVAYLGVVTSAMLAFLRLVLIRRAGYALVSYTGFLVPISSVFIGVVFLNETLPANAYAALGVAFGALGLSQLTPGVFTRWRARS